MLWWCSTMAGVAVSARWPSRPDEAARLSWRPRHFFHVQSVRPTKKQDLDTTLSLSQCDVMLYRSVLVLLRELYLTQDTTFLSLFFNSSPHHLSSYVDTHRNCTQWSTGVPSWDWNPKILARQYEWHLQLMSDCGVVYIGIANSKHAIM